MRYSKNDTSISSNEKRPSKTRDRRKSAVQKVKLSPYKACSFMKTYRPLKRKKIKLHKLKFISDSFDPNFPKTIKIPEEGAIFAERSEKSGDKWSCEKEIIDWLASVNIDVKRLNASSFILKNKICSLSCVLLFANKKRVELGLNPFYMEGVTEC